MKAIRILAVLSLFVVCSVFSNQALSAGSEFWNAWRILKDSWISDEFEFSCSSQTIGLPFSHYRLSKSVGSINLLALNQSMNWQELNVNSISDAGLSFSDFIYLSDANITQLVKNTQPILDYTQKMKTEFQENKQTERGVSVNAAQKALDACLRKYGVPGDARTPIECVSQSLELTMSEHIGRALGDLFTPPIWNISVDERSVRTSVEINFKDQELTATYQDSFNFIATLQSDKSVVIKDIVNVAQSRTASCTLN